MPLTRFGTVPLEAVIFPRDEAIHPDGIVAVSSKIKLEHPLVQERHPLPRACEEPSIQLTKGACSSTKPDRWKVYSVTRNKAVNAIKAAKLTYLNHQAHILTDPNVPLLSGGKWRGTCLA